MLDLTVPAAKETALLELSKKRESFPELAPYLWHSFGTMAALLQEIVSIYPMLQPPSLTAHASNRVCNALALLQCVASHPETRSLFLQGEQWAGACWCWVMSGRQAGRRHQALNCGVLALQAVAARAAAASSALPRLPPPLPPSLPPCSPHPSVPVPLPQHHQQDAAL